MCRDVFFFTMQEDGEIRGCVGSVFLFREREVGRVDNHLQVVFFVFVCFEVIRIAKPAAEN